MPKLKKICQELVNGIKLWLSILVTCTEMMNSGSIYDKYLLHVGTVTLAFDLCKTTGQRTMDELITSIHTAAKREIYSTFEHNPCSFGVSVTHKFSIICSKHCQCRHHAPIIGLPCLASHVKHKHLKKKTQKPHRHMTVRITPLSSNECLTNFPL